MDPTPKRPSAFATTAGTARAWRRGLACAALATLATSISAIPAHAQTRWVFVNGQRLSDAQVLRVARANCTPIADGHYWWNEATGAWGVVGHPRPLGVLGQPCRRGAPSSRRPSLSERGLLYRPWEIIDSR